MLNLIKKISEERTDFLLELVGGDPVRNLTFFQKKVAEMKLTKFVKFSGMVPHEEVFLRLTNADVFVLFSNFEGLPCSMLEGMAIGLPVITTEIGDMDKWITSDVGKVIPIGDETALFDAFIFMLDNFRNFDTKNIQNRISETCSYDVIGQQLTTLYEQALNDIQN